MTSRRKVAVADALAGVIGTLVSLWAFYPIELIKTNLQAGGGMGGFRSRRQQIKQQQNHPGSRNDDGTNHNNRLIGLLLSSFLNKIDDKRYHKTTAASDDVDNDSIRHLCSRVSHILRTMFRGCRTKTIQAASSSFCYFYLYSWIVSLYQKRKKISNTKGATRMHPSTRLILSAIAAVINTFLTLPLDVLSSQHVVTTSKHDGGDYDSNDNNQEKNNNNNNNNVDTMDQVWSSLSIGNVKTKTPTTFSSTSSFPTATESSSSSSSSSSSNQHIGVVDEDEEDDDPSSTTSDLIFHEAYPDESFLVDDEKQELSLIHENSEVDKSLEIIDIDNETTTRYNRKGQSNQHQRRNDNIETRTDTLMLFQKYAPLWKGLIPALLLCSNPSIHYTTYDVLKNRLLSRSYNRGNGTRLSMSQSFVLGLVSKFVATIVTYPLIRAKVILMVTSETSMVSSLIRSYKEEGGIKGLYRGCDWQLIHTLLKSALMMMVRESITEQTHRLVLGSNGGTTNNQG
jgi:hypothetical protein